jgi:hypothetical protein
VEAGAVEAPGDADGVEGTVVGGGPVAVVPRQALAANAQIAARAAIRIEPRARGLLCIG